MLPGIDNVNLGVAVLTISSRVGPTRTAADVILVVRVRCGPIREWRRLVEHVHRCQSDVSTSQPAVVFGKCLAHFVRRFTSIIHEFPSALEFGAYSW